MKKSFSSCLLLLFSCPFLCAAPNITDGGDGTKNVEATATTDNNFLKTYQQQILSYSNTPIIKVIGTGSFYATYPKSALLGFILNATNSQTEILNGKQSITFHVDTTKINNTYGAMFFAGGKNPRITMDTNLSIDFTTNSNIGLGVFLSGKNNATDPLGNDQLGTFTFNKNLIVNTENVDQSSGGYIFNIDQKKGQIYVNYSNNSSVNTGNIIQLKGNFHINGDEAALNIYLTNNNSYLVGREDYKKGAFNLGLSGGGKWVVTDGDVKINTLAIGNTKDPNTNVFLQTTDIYGDLSYIDIATRRFNNPYTQRKIYIDTLQTNGDKGVFRTLVDIPNNQGDLVTIKNDTSGKHYLQIFQKTSDLDNLTKSAEIKVAEVLKGGKDLVFEALPARIGLYNYSANIIKEVQNEGFKWVLRVDKEDPPMPPEPDEEIVDSINRLMTLQYRIYRVQTDSINKHIDELVYTTTKHNFWGDYYIGSQSHKSSKDNYQAFQGGYDYGWNFGRLRQFAGGYFDFARMKDYDTDYDGSVNNFGFAGYYQANYEASKKTTLNLDMKMKYNYSSNNFFPKNILAGADFVDSYHLFFLGGRIGSKISFGRKYSWFIEPSGNAGIGFMSGGYINIVDQVTQRNFGGTQDSASIVLLDANLAIGKRFFNTQNYFDIRGGVGYAYNNNTGGDITFIDVNAQNNFTVNTLSDHRMKIFLSANASFNNIFKLYANFSRTFFSNFNTTYLFNFGFRLSFQDFSFKINRSYSRVETANRKPNNNQDELEKRRARRILQGSNQRPLPRLYRD
ncbi:hypothetical protein [Helicobacter anatolicus]|uniref:hypothetical protein n=1 Tax=Helicobacter anatolicus TaxID=2905874 RepID=UPI001E52CFB3|nr:hypothetical protein [Helicobacter anatolicus]MCE3040421.1 hypothetical protein [Helicobacter anatolicus]